MSFHSFPFAFFAPLEAGKEANKNEENGAKKQI